MLSVVGRKFSEKFRPAVFPFTKIKKQNKTQISLFAAKESESVKTNFFLLLLKS